MIFNFRVLISLIAATVIIVIGGTFFNAQSYAQILSNPSHSTLLASVWDQSQESYSGNKNMTVYRSPSCGCCGEWIKHIQKQGFQVKDIKTNDIEAIKQKYKLPSNLASCHTAIIDNYVMEGHIPADDIKRFLKEKPKFAGLSVPEMLIGTPGMEMGNRKQPFEVLAFNSNGKTQVFKRYEKY